MKKRTEKEAYFISPHPLIETHCHLDYLEDEDAKMVLNKCAEVGVEKIITIGVSPDNLQTVVDLADSFSNVFCSQGVHPHDAKEYNESAERTIRLNATRDKVVAIGEIGLDYYYDHSPRKTQKRVFELQLELAVEYKLPVIIHARDADEDIMAILSNVAIALKDQLVIHSFSSGLDLAEFALNNDFFLGFNGMITFKNAENVRSALCMTPIDRLLIETDSPYLTPIPHRGKKNYPYYLPFVARACAEVKKLPMEQLFTQVYQNSSQLFSI